MGILGGLAWCMTVLVWVVPLHIRLGNLQRDDEAMVMVAV